MNICFVIDSMKCGGMQRVASTLVNGWVRAGHAVTLLTFDSTERDFFDLEPGVARIGLQLEGQSANTLQKGQRLFSRLTALRRHFNTLQPDVVVSFGEKTNFTVILSALGSGIPVVISERTDPRRHRQSFAWRLGRFWLYRLADFVVLQTSGVRDWAASFLNVKKLRVVGNPVDLQHARASMREQRANQIVGVGRLSREKGFDLLIEAFARADRADWQLVIVGDGPERASLEALAGKLGIQDRTRFAGAVKDPFQILGAAKVFVLPSRYEGFPNALLEAMASGCCVVSFDCDSGPSDLINQGINGVLVEPGSASALARSLGTVTAKPNKLQALMSSASPSVAGYATDKILEEWTTVLVEAAA